MTSAEEQAVAAPNSARYKTEKAQFRPRAVAIGFDGIDKIQGSLSLSLFHIWYYDVITTDMAE